MIPTVIRVWWNHNRNIIFLIPMIVGIIGVILWSSTFPPVLQDWVIGMGVAVAFGVPGLLIAWGTVQAWRYLWFVLEMPQLADSVYVPFVTTGMADSRPLVGSRDRFATVIHSARELPELEEVPGWSDVVSPSSFKVRSKGRLWDRIDLTGYGLVFFRGMPAVAHGVEKLHVAPSLTVASGADEGSYRMLPTFELISTERGDYKMLTHPAVQDAMWDAWKAVSGLGSDKPAEEPGLPSVGKQTTSSLQSSDHPSATAVMAYCITCKSRREVKDPESRQLKNGRSGVSGLCPVCGKKLFAITGGGKP